MGLCGMLIWVIKIGWLSENFVDSGQHVPVASMRVLINISGARNHFGVLQSVECLEVAEREVLV